MKTELTALRAANKGASTDEIRDRIVELLAAEVLRLREEVDALGLPAKIDRAKELAARFDK